MKILVCIRSVPLPEGDFRVNAKGDFYDEDGVKFTLNEYDLYAIEEAVRIKERFKDVEVSVISVGPSYVEDVIRKGIAQGADFGFRIDDGKERARDSFSIASLIAEWAKDKNFDLIICGVMSEDLMRSQTGPMLAELLGISCACSVISLEIREDWKTIFCERELEGGLREKVELDLPALITVQSGINTPRYASLSNVLRSREIEIPYISAESLGGVRTGERILRAYIPDRSGHCEFLKGSPDELAEQLIERIKARVRII